MLALHKMIEANNECVGLITTTNQDKGSWVHDIKLNILYSIADKLSLNFYPFAIEQANYTDDFILQLLEFKKDEPFDAIVFGDIDILEHRQWCENLCRKVGVKAIFPLWQQCREDIICEFIDLGYQAIIKKVMKDKLDKTFLTRTLNYKLIEELKNSNVDVCGENGEYHTLVYNGPLFETEVLLKFGKFLENEYTYGIEVELADNSAINE